MEASKVIKYPVSNEKAIRMIESENKLTFIVDSSAKKDDIKNAVEKLFNVKVEKVRVVNEMKGTKKAEVKLSSENHAMDIATQLGLM